jgi:hypothetical protein
VIALALAACGGESSGTFDAEIAPIFVQCSGCHQGDEPAAGLDLSGDADAVYAAIVDVPSQQDDEMLLVEPGDYLYSYLWHKVNGTQAIAYGSGAQMPVGRELTDAEVIALAAWIDDGAPR